MAQIGHPDHVSRDRHRGGIVVLHQTLDMFVNQMQEDQHCLLDDLRVVQVHEFRHSQSVTGLTPLNLRIQTYESQGSDESLAILSESRIRIRQAVEVSRINQRRLAASHSQLHPQ